MKYPAYPSYKPSGIDWLGDVPEHWDILRLKNAAKYFVSNVDKKTADEEWPVRLCNYTDVYYNDFIQSSYDFMEATADVAEVRRFALQVGDIVITKDSEDWRDIAVPALVESTAPDLVCGYHLGIIRPKSACAYSRYIFRSVQSYAINQQFQLAATGVTRYGLPKSSVGDSWIPLPPLDEQKRIAHFLDAQTARIDRLVAKKRALIARLKEKRSALISRTVTRGLPPAAARAANLPENPPLKPTGIPWLGNIPEHWDVVSVRYAFHSLNWRRIPISAEDRASLDKVYPYYGASGIIDYVDDYLFDEPLILVAEDGANLLSRSTPLAFMAIGKYWVNNHAHILKPKAGDIRYWTGVLQSHDYTPLVTGAAQPKLTSDRLGSVHVPRPPESEQRAIAEYLHKETTQLDSISSKIEDAIERLEEYRTALITAAVTGKIDVRGQVPALADEEAPAEAAT